MIRHSETNEIICGIKDENKIWNFNKWQTARDVQINKRTTIKVPTKEQLQKEHDKKIQQNNKSNNNKKNATINQQKETKWMEYDKKKIQKLRWICKNTYHIPLKANIKHAKLVDMVYYKWLSFQSSEFINDDDINYFRMYGYDYKNENENENGNNNNQSQIENENGNNNNNNNNNDTNENLLDELGSTDYVPNSLDECELSNEEDKKDNEMKLQELDAMDKVDQVLQDEIISNSTNGSEYEDDSDIIQNKSITGKKRKKMETSMEKPLKKKLKKEEKNKKKCKSPSVSGKKGKSPIISGKNIREIMQRWNVERAATDNNNNNNANPLINITNGNNNKRQKNNKKELDEEN